jgi:hypothetical protein
MAFSIHIADGRRRIGEIQIGAFSEYFHAHGGWPLSRFRTEWRSQLEAVLSRKRKGMLPTTAKASKVYVAWIIYRHNRRLYVQQRYYVRRGFDLKNGRIDSRRIKDEEGRRLSEWSVNLREVAAFLKKTPNQALQPTALLGRG